MAPLPMLGFTVLTLAVVAWPARAAEGPALARFSIDGDAIREPLAGARGDPARGRELILARDPANCVLCHTVPDPEVRFAGDVGPPLAGVGGRLSAGQIRLRIV